MDLVLNLSAFGFKMAKGGMNEPISHKCQCIHSVVPQLETTLTSQPGRLLMYLP